MEHPDIESLLREADDAFWEVVARRFPSAKTGDLSPLTTLAFHQAAEAAIREWVRNNIRPQEAGAVPAETPPASPQPETGATASAPAKRSFCVWADCVRRVYQHVEADGPVQAHEIARQHAESWEPCDGQERIGYLLSNEVQDVATEEFTPVHGTKSCRTCGSEIVETINDSNFRDGECGPCEYHRYRTQPELLALVQALREDCSNQIQQYQGDLKEDFGDPDDLQEQVEHWTARRNQCDSAIANANAHAA
jgi:hypothetical protein